MLINYTHDVTMSFQSHQHTAEGLYMMVQLRREPREPSWLVRAAVRASVLDLLSAARTSSRVAGFLWQEHVRALNCCPDREVSQTIRQAWCSGTDCCRKQWDKPIQTLVPCSSSGSKGLEKGVPAWGEGHACFLCLSTWMLRNLCFGRP